MEQPTGKQTMAPGFFSPSKTDCFSPFHLTLKAFLFFSSFIFCLQSSPTISIYNNNNREDDANSRISQLFTPLISLYSNTTVVETSLVIGIKYIALFSVLCFLWFLAISLKVWNFGRYPDSFLMFWAIPSSSIRVWVNTQIAILHFLSGGCVGLVYRAILCEFWGWMGIETTRADRKVKEFRELPTDTNTSPNSRSKRSRRRQKKMLPVQKLFEICKEVFANGGTGIVPCSEDIERLKAVLGMFFFP